MKEILHLIGKDQTEKAAEQLYDLIDNDSESIKELILIKSRLSNLESERRKGTTSEENLILEENKIKDALIDLTFRITSGATEATRRNSNNYDNTKSSLSPPKFIFRRPHGYAILKFTPADIYINNDYVGSINPNEKVEINVQEGKNSISIKGNFRFRKPRTLKIQIKNGEEKEFEINEALYNGFNLKEKQ